MEAVVVVWERKQCLHRCILCMCRLVLVWGARGTQKLSIFGVERPLLGDAETATAMTLQESPSLLQASHPSGKSRHLYTPPCHYSNHSGSASYVPRLHPAGRQDGVLLG